VNGWITYFKNNKIEEYDSSKISENKVTRNWFTKKLSGRLGKIGLIILINILTFLLTPSLEEPRRFSDVVVINLVLTLLMILHWQLTASLTLIVTFLCGMAIMMTG
jgi:hypothetical protein